MGCTTSSTSSLAEAQPASTASIVPLHGVSLKHFVAVVEENGARKLTVSEFCDKVVKAKTAQKKCSYAEYCLLSGQSKWVKAKADVFVSYAWKYTVGDVLDCLMAGRVEEGEADTFIWLDCLTVNQHISSQVDQELWFTTFSTALKSIGRAELVLIPWEKPIPVERSWCVFEQYILTSQSIPFKPKMLERDKKEIIRRIRKNIITFDSFMNMFASIDCEKSKAFKREDQDQILKLIRSQGAVKATNDATLNAVKSFILDLLTDYASDCKEKRPMEIETAYAYQALANLYDALGESDKAVSWFRMSLDTRRKVYNNEPNAEIASALNDLVACLSKLGRDVEMEPLLRECIDMKKSVLGPDDPDTPKAEGWLAGLLFRREDYSGALKLFKRNLEENIRILGPSHALVGTSHSNVASCLHHLGRTDEALVEALSAVKVSKAALGESHSVVGTSLNTLAIVYDELKQPQKAVECYLEALEIQKKILGAMHPSVAISLNNLAITYEDLGDRAKAQELGTEALNIMKARYGLQHPKTKQLIEAWG